MKLAASLHDRVLAAAEAAREHLAADSADVAIILGSGLASAADRLQGGTAVLYSTLPAFPEPTVAGHPGRLLCGAWGDQRVLIFCGRLHTYEGYPASEIAFPVRVAATLGVRTLIVTNVAGGIEPSYGVGEIIAIRDHLNLTGASPLSGPNDERFGPRFIDMSEPYAPELRRLASELAQERFGSALREGVYVSMPGPSYETKAEVAMLRMVGADLVGMSTVHEVIAARHCGLAVLGLSLVANPAAGIQATPLCHEDVTAAAAAGAARMGELLEAVVTRLPSPASDS
jgi:purine-nucleoside phosphorylase